MVACRPMLPLIVAFGLLLHLAFWGSGLAMLAMPRPWSRFWPILAPAAGCALQTLVVWAGAYADLRGTNAYAWPGEIIPAALLALGLWRRRARVLREIARLGAVWAVVAGCLAALVRPLALAAPGLTTVSLGNCDAADYAAGARVLMEFAHSDRSGFLGLAQVVRVMSVDNFFDFWLRLNHFTPSALIALNGTIFHCVPHELTGLLTAVIMAAILPVVFWTARAVFGYRLATGLWITAVFGLSPIMAYAVFQVAMGQLLAAPAIAFATWAGVALWRGAARVRHGWRFTGLLAIAYGLILGSYNFIVIVALVPALAYAAGSAALGGEWKRFGSWLWRMLLPLALAGAVFWTRVAGLAERFRLFRTYDFGWRIPGFSPEGWYGLVQGPGLDPLPFQLRVVLTVLLAAVLAAACWSGALRQKGRGFLALALAAPILSGYGTLVLRGARLGTNASYDAYKLFAVFYPVVLPALCVWLAPPPCRSRRGARTAWGAAAFLGVIVAGNLLATRAFWRAAEIPPLVVDRDLIGVRKAEEMPQVGSVNMRVPDMWSRLWANAFLLRKPQYFLTHTYEGRLNTPLRGEWDLDGGLVSVDLPDGGSLRINPRFSLVRVSSPYYVRAELADGWYDEERLPRSSLRWRWSSGSAGMDLVNPGKSSLRTALELDGEALSPRELQVWAGDREIASARLGTRRSDIRTPPFDVPPGTTRLELRSDVPPMRPSGGDSRLLGFKVYGLVVEVRAERDEMHP